MPWRARNGLNEYGYLRIKDAQFQTKEPRQFWFPLPCAQCVVVYGLEFVGGHGHI